MQKIPPQLCRYTNRTGGREKTRAMVPAHYADRLRFSLD